MSRQIAAKTMDPRTFRYRHNSPRALFPFANALLPSRGTAALFPLPKAPLPSCSSAPQRGNERYRHNSPFKAVLPSKETCAGIPKAPPKSLWNRLFPPRQTMRIPEFDGSQYNLLFAYAETYLIAKFWAKNPLGIKLTLPENHSIEDVFKGTRFSWILVRRLKIDRKEDPPLDALKFWESENKYMEAIRMLIRYYRSFSCTGTRTFFLTYSPPEHEKVVKSYLPHIEAFVPEKDLNGYVRVTNLSPNTRDQHLLSLFNSFGPVSQAYITPGGIGMVDFVYKKDAAKAISRLNGYDYDNIILRVEWAAPIINENTVRVDNLSVDTRELALHDLFSPFGSIRRAFIAYDPQTGMSRGFGFVTFFFKDDAQRAIHKLNGRCYDNVTLGVKWVPVIRPSSLAKCEWPARQSSQDDEVLQIMAINVPEVLGVDENLDRASGSKVVMLTMIARVTDGLPLAEGLDDGRDQKDVEFYKHQAKALFKNLSKGQNQPSRMSLETGPNVFHYIIEGHVCYLTMCDRSYPKKLAFQYLEDLKNEFEKVNGGQIETAARPYAFIKFDTFIQKTKKLYQDTRTQRNISKLNDELYEVHQIMTRNVQEVLGVGEKLDQVSEMSSRLTSESRIYADKARDLNRQALIRKWAPVAIVLGVVILLFWVRKKIW